MEASGYSMDLYCDAKSNRHQIDYFPHKYFGETRQQCLRQAREAGWIFHRNGTHTCPICAKAKEAGDE